MKSSSKKMGIEHEIELGVGGYELYALEHEIEADIEV